MQVFLERLFDGITNGSVYSAMALALVMVFRGTGTINFAQGEMALISTYLAWGLTTKHVPVWLALIISMVAGFLLGAGTERFLIRPMQKRSLLGVLIILLGLFSALNSIDGLVWGQSNHSLASLFPNTLSSYVTFDGARLYYADLGVWLLTALLVAMIWLLFNRTRLGLNMRATSANKESADLAGISTGTMLMLGWGLSAAIGAVVGVMITPLTPDGLGLAEMLPIFLFASAAALFGGLSSPVGAVVAGLIIGIFEVMITGYVPAIGGQLQEGVALIVIVAVLLIRPQGLFGRKALERV